MNFVNKNLHSNCLLAHQTFFDKRFSVAQPTDNNKLILYFQYFITIFATQSLVFCWLFEFVFPLQLVLIQSKATVIT